MTISNVKNFQMIIDTKMKDVVYNDYATLKHMYVPLFIYNELLILKT